MANNSKKYVSLSKLSTFLDNIKTKFAAISHKHTMNDITDYTVDNALSSTSINPVQNKVIDAEFEAISEAMNALDLAIDGKAPSSHNHNDLYYTETEVDTKLSGKADSTHNHDDDYDAKNSASNALASAKEYTNTKVANLVSTSTVDTKISTHNTSTSAHNDIRDLISGLTTRLNTLANSDDTTLDQLSEIVAYIKNNKSLIDGITTSKVNVADIINNLTTNVSNKPLSAAQGVAIKALIDDLQEELDSHGHEIADVNGLQDALDGKANSSHGRHVSYSKTAPAMDGVASVGVEITVARSDHAHPTDTSRASKEEFDSHTGNTTVHITATERTNWNAAKTHADSAHAPSNAEKNQNAFSNIKVGSTTIAADTATDTLELVGSNVTITPDATNDKVTIAVASGSTSTAGIVKLTNSTSSTSTTTAATPSSVKSAYDKAVSASATAANAQDIADEARTLARTNADWNQNNPSSVDYIKNRTHWITEGANVVVPATTQQSIRKSKTGASNWQPEYDFNKLYVVTVDGVQYGCTPYELDDGYGTMSFTLGDSRLRETSDDSHPEDVPFLVQAYVEDDGGSGATMYHHWYFSYPTSGTHTIKIAEAECHTINENFIPNTIARASAVSQVQIVTWEDND